MASDEKKCKYCGSKESSLAVNEEGNTYQRRTRNPHEEDSWVCGRCGGVWHADPRKYEPNDTLFFGSKISRTEWKNVTAEDKWRKDGTHNNYLKSKGYTVVRFWEKEIKCDIDWCIEILKKRIQAFKKLHDK